MRFFVRDGKRSAKKAILIVMSIMALVAQPLYGVVASQVAKAAAGDPVCVQGGDCYASILDAVANTPNNGTINLMNDIVVTRQITIKKNLTLNGNGHKISSPFNKAAIPAEGIIANDNNSAISPQGAANTVTINNLTIDGAGSGTASATGLHGINVYKSNATLNNVTIMNFRNTAVNINSSEVTINGITTSGNTTGFYQVIELANNVSRAPKLTITGVSHHAEVARSFGFLSNHIGIAGTGAVFTDTNSQYTTSGTYRNLLPPPAANPVLTGENFNTNDDANYKGINVGFNINNDFGTVSSVKVELYKGGDLLVTNTHNQALLDLINVDGVRQLSTPFIITPGTYVEDYWNLGSRTWTTDDKPTMAKVTVVGANGTKSVELTPLTEPNGWNFESLVTPGIPGGLRYAATTTPQTVSPAKTCGAFTNINFSRPTWDAVPGAVSYDYQALRNGSVIFSTNYTTPQHPGGSFANGQNATYSFQVRSVNAGGLKSAWSTSCDITLDTVTPNISWQLQPNAIYGIGQGFHVRPITSEVGTIKAIYFDSVAPANLIWTLDSDHKNFDTKNTHNQALWDALSDGTHKFVAVFEDYAGNSDTSSSNNFIIDRTAPTAWIKGDSNAYAPASIGSHTAGIYKKISYKLFDSKKIDKVVINGVTKNLTDNNWSDVDNIVPGLYGAVEGANTMVVYDVAGNTTTYTFILDTTVPKVDLTAPTGTTNANSVEVKGWATDANMRYYACYITTNQPIYAFGTNWSTGQEPKDAGNSLADSACVTTWTSVNVGDSSNPVTLGYFDISGLPDGTYTIHMHAHDLAGNQNEATTEFTIDRTAPAVTIDPIADSTNTMPTITGTVDADANSVEVSFDGGAHWLVATYTAGDTTWSYAVTTKLGTGANTVLARATDAVGNITNPVATENFTVTVASTDTGGNQGQSNGGGSSVTQSAATTTSPVNTVLNRSAAGNVATTDGTDTTEADDTDDTDVLAATTDDNDADSNDGQVLAAKDTKGNWSVVNLVLAVVTIILSLGALLGLARKKDGTAARIMTLIPVAIAVTAFLMIENWTASMIWLNWWTVLYAVVLAVQVAIVSGLKNSAE